LFSGILVLIILVVMRYRHHKRMAELNTVDDDLAYQVSFDIYTKKSNHISDISTCVRI
jgi:hypothetical protein